MLHPVLPPDSPPILEYIKPANSAASTPVLEARTDVQKLATSGNIEASVGLPTPKQANQDSLVVSNELSPSPQPEILPPELSPRNTTGSDSRLQPSFGVGDPQKEVSDRHNQSAAKFSQLSNELANKSNLWLSDSPVVIKNVVLAQQPIAVTVQKSEGKINLFGSTSTVGDTPGSRLVQNVIEFKPRSSNHKPSTSTTVEFPPPTEPSSSPNQPSGNTSQVRQRVVEVVSDNQEYDEQRRIITAEGHVVVRFDGAVIDADRLQVNLDNLIAVGEGSVALTRGNQVLRGQRFTYNFVQDSGDLENGRGEIYVPTTQTDLAFAPTATTDITAGGVPSRPLSDRIRANQPLSGINSPGGADITFGGTADATNIPPPKTGGVVKRLRFEAQRIDFYPRGWQAENVRITNDPFSPPELELRASKVTMTREAPLIDRITTQHQRLVFDQKTTLPIPIDNQTIDRRERQVNPFIVSPGYDGSKRGGLFVERQFTAITTDKTNWSITPQFFVQKAFTDNSNVADLFGVKTKLSSVLSSKATVEGKGELTSLDLSKVEDNLRGSLRLRQLLGDVNPYTLNLEYSYRDRLYNGTLGYQTVQSSLGGVLISPNIPLGKSGINLNYQAGAQYINANTDRQDLLEPQRQNDRISLGRLQGSASLNKGFLLWQGKPLAATPTEGLKYTPNPVVPYLQAISGLTGTTSYYTNGDNQSTLTGTIGLVGQIGHFSRPFLDYTAFNISYSQGLNSGLSPFLFDRSVDNRVLTAGISQQIYGPFRLGFQTSVNLDTGKESSTDYIIEYNRRTYGIILRYNPVLELGGFSIRISDFNWTGGTDPFSEGDIKPVVNGVRQDN